jgi:hypothetical protein
MRYGVLAVFVPSGPKTVVKGYSGLYRGKLGLCAADLVKLTFRNFLGLVENIRFQTEVCSIEFSCQDVPWRSSTGQPEKNTNGALFPIGL